MIMGNAANIFFMGKGGVGKSTSSALTALLLAKSGYKVLLVSLDPAHNQCDIFEKDLSNKPLEIAPNLLAMEADQDLWVKRYLKSVHSQIDKTYAYLTALNLDKYFKVIRHSPGLEEYALILAYKTIRKDFARRDFLIFDMPPTALSLKFFSLPSLSLVWVDQLLALRQEIIEKRELITRVKWLNKEVERDKVLKKIRELNEEYQELKGVFEDRAQTQIKLVLNPDRLSFAESLRIVRELKDIDIALNQVVYNKMAGEASCAHLDKPFLKTPVVGFPYSERPLIGLEALTRFLEENSETMQQQLNICAKVA